jgi:hypothetical protein
VKSKELVTTVSPRASSNTLDAPIATFRFAGSQWTELKAHLAIQRLESTGQRVIIMEGLSQSTFSIVGSQVAIDPDLFCDHFNLSNPTQSPTLRSQKYPGLPFMIKPNPTPDEHSTGFQDLEASCGLRGAQYCLV